MLCIAIRAQLPVRGRWNIKRAPRNSAFAVTGRLLRILGGSSRPSPIDPEEQVDSRDEAEQHGKNHHPRQKEVGRKCAGRRVNQSPQNPADEPYWCGEQYGDQQRPSKTGQDMRFRTADRNIARTQQVAHDHDTSDASREKPTRKTAKRPGLS